MNQMSLADHLPDDPYTEVEREAHNADRYARDLAAFNRVVPDVSDVPGARKGDGCAEPLPPDQQADLVRRLATDLARYLDSVETFLCRYVAFPSEHEPRAIALWIAHAHLIEQVEVSPILAITSAEMRSGKTRVLDCLSVLVPHPERMVTPSAAVAYRLMAERPRPTFLLDEADAIFGTRRQADQNEPLRAALNSGNRPGTTVPRVSIDGKSHRVERLDVFGAKAIAGIGDLPDTVADRSIIIRMRRRAPSERVEPFRQRRASGEARAIPLPDWGVHLEPEVLGMPDRLNDRQQDSWEPLLAIADAAGGLWPVLAREAAEALSDMVEGAPSDGIRLLTDIREAFVGAQYLTVQDLLVRLHRLDDAPWGDWYGSALTARGVAKLLAPYRIKSRQRRIPGSGPVRAYFRQDFEDAWSRYVGIGPRGNGGTSGTSDTADTNRTGEDTAGCVADDSAE